MNIYKIMCICCFLCMTCGYVHAMERPACLTDLPDDILIKIVAQGYRSGANNTEREDFATIMQSVSHRFFVLSKSPGYAREMHNNTGDLAFKNTNEYLQHMAGNAIKFSPDYELMRYRLLQANNKEKKLFYLKMWLNICLKKNKALTLGGIFVGSFTITVLLAILLRVSLKKIVIR